MAFSSRQFEDIHTDIATSSTKRPSGPEAPQADDVLRHLLRSVEQDLRRALCTVIAVGLLFSAGIAAMFWRGGAGRLGETEGTGAYTLSGERAAGSWRSIRAQRQRPGSAQERLLFLSLDAQSPDHLMDLLKTHELWDLEGKMTVPPVVFSGYPGKLDALEPDTRKKLFLHALLPTAMVAQAEIEAERKMLLKVFAKVKGFPEDTAFEPEKLLWQAVLSQKEIRAIKHLTEKYRTDRLSELLRRVDTVPVSLIMAQGAVESSWGSSRFAADGNNLFGVWTWGEQGIVPEGREEDKKHKVAAYDSIIGSIHGYLLTLNRLPAYASFREIRARSRNSLELVDGLTQYSERREEYVSMLKDIIRINNLQQYDSLVLSPDIPTGHSGGVRITSIGPRTGKTLL